MWDVPWFRLFSSANFFGVLGLDKTLWNLFGLDLDAVVRSLVVPSSLEKQLREVDMRLMWTGPLLFSLSSLDIRWEVDHVRKRRYRDKVPEEENEVSTFHLSLPPPYFTNARDGSHIKCFHR